MATWLEWRQKNKPNKTSILNPISRPPQAFTSLLLNTNTAGSHPHFIRTTHSAPSTPGKLPGLTAVIRAQQPAVVAISANAAPIVSTGILANSLGAVAAPAGNAIPAVAATVNPGQPTGVLTATPSGHLTASPGVPHRAPIIQQHSQPHQHSQQPQKVHIQAGQHQQSIVLPVRTTPLTTQGNVTATVTSVSYPLTNQQLTTPSLPNHPAGAIQTVKIGGGQAQVSYIL